MSHVIHGTVYCHVHVLCGVGHEYDQNLCVGIPKHFQSTG